jgi:hypothetical protein
MSSPRTLTLCLILITAHAPAALAVGDLSEAGQGSFEALSDDLGGAVAETRSPSVAPGRMALYESAHMYSAGEGAWTSLDLGIHRVDYALTDNLQMGVMTALPIGFLAVVPELKFGGEVLENLHASVTVRAAALIVPEVTPIFAYGGHAALTYGTPDLHVTAGVHAYGLSLKGVSRPVAWAVHPTLGGVARVSDFALLHLDVGPVVLGDIFSSADCFPGCGDSREAQMDVWLIKYGARFHGDAWFGDVSFVIPVHEAWTELAAYLPLGIPTLTLGYAF